LLGKLQSIGVGVLAAAVTVLVMDRVRQRPTQARVTEASPRASGERFVRAAVLEGGGLARINELERQLRELQASVAAKSDDSNKEEALSRADLLRERDEAYARFEQAHDRDTPDAEWSPAAQEQLLSGLNRLGQKLAFEVGPVDCKTTTCRATISWSDYGSARASTAALVEHYYPGLNCAQRVRMKAPEDQNAPYSAELYLDCTDQRAGLVDEPPATSTETQP
jgi:hypothetical protein